jgi:serine/threonine protein kinase
MMGTSNGGGSSSSSSSGNAVSNLRCAVLELLPCSLHDVIVRTGPAPQRVIKGVVVQLLGTLCSLHRGQLGKRIVHRDIKPGNILAASLHYG